MSFLPIVERELRVRSRAPSTHGIRMAAALIAIGLVGWLILVMQGNVGRGQTGRTVFLAINWLALVFCLLEGPRVASDILSREKRQGTLGLLFLTRLRGYDVVLGKLSACSLNSVYSLLALLPPAAVPFLIGGVTGPEFGRVILALGNALFLSLTLGILISAISRTERDAFVGTVAAVALLAVGPILLKSPPPLFQLSPVLPLLNALDTGYRLDPSTYWTPLKLTHGMAWLSLVAACLILPRNWSDRQPTRPPSWRPAFLTKRRTRQRRIDLARNPVIWLARQPMRSSVYVWLTVLAAGVTGVTWSVFNFPGDDLDALFVPVLGALLVHAALTVSVALQACYVFPHARDSGELEVLLTTPLKSSEIVRGYTESLRALYRQPMMFLLTVEALVVGGQCVALFVLSPVDELLTHLLVTAAIGLCIAGSVLDLEAAARFGLWMGLRTPRPSVAVTKTIAAVLLVPLLPLLVCFILAPFVWVAKNLVLIRVSGNELNALFRRTAAEHFTAVLPTQTKKKKPMLPSVVEPADAT